MNDDIFVLEICMDRFKAAGWSTITVDYENNNDSDLHARLDLQRNWEDNAKAVVAKLKYSSFNPSLCGSHCQFMI
jgi:transketolase N-terminal domain/subunit